MSLYERRCVAGGAMVAALLLVGLAVRIRSAANDARVELQTREALLDRLDSAQRLVARGQLCSPGELEIITGLFPGTRLQQVQAGDAVVLAFGKPLPSAAPVAVAGASPAPSSR